MKTNELTRAALNWAVAKCMTGGEIFQSGRVAHAVVLHVVGGTTAPYFVKDSGVVRCAFEPSTDWAQGGPIIERAYIELHTYSENDDGIVTWRANDFMDGPTPLIAAMRCYVASKMGDEVDVPTELLEDGQAIGIDGDGNVICWDATKQEPYNSGENEV